MSRYVISLFSTVHFLLVVYKYCRMSWKNFASFGFIGMEDKLLLFSCESLVQWKRTPCFVAALKQILVLPDCLEKDLPPPHYAMDPSLIRRRPFFEICIKYHFLYMFWTFENCSNVLGGIGRSSSNRVSRVPRINKDQFFWKKWNFVTLVLGIVERPKWS